MGKPRFKNQPRFDNSGTAEPATTYAKDPATGMNLPDFLQTPAGVDPVDTPEEFQRMSNESLGSDIGELIMSPVSGLVNAAATTPYAIGKGSQWLANTLEDNFRELVLGQPGAGRTTEEAKQREADQEQYLKPAADLSRNVRETIYQPKTDIGQALETGGEFMLGGWPSRATRMAPLWADKGIGYAGDVVSNVALPAIGSEIGGALTEGTDGETLARLFGGFTGAGVGAFTRGLGNPVESIVRRSTRDMTPEQWQRSLETSDLARTMPIKPTGPEIISQATNGGSPLTNVQRYVEGDVIHGGRVMGPFMADRPRQFEAANEQIMDRLGIPQSPRPTTLGAEAGEAGKLAIGNVMEQRTAASAPDYAAANPQLMPEADVRAIIANMDAEIAADTTGTLQHSLGELRTRLRTAEAVPAVPPAPTGILDHRGNPIMDQGTPEVPEQFALDIQNMDRARMRLRDTQDTIATSSDPNRAAFEGESGARLTHYLNQFNQLMRRNSNSFSAAQDAYQTNTTHMVDPIVNGPVGKVANAGGDTRAAGDAAWPSNPLPGVAPEISDAITRMQNVDPQRVDPQTIPQLLRNVWEDRFGTAMEPTQQGNRQFGGAKFFNTIAGTQGKRDVLHAVLGALPTGQAGLPFVNDILSLMQTTGHRRPVGSATEFNKSLSDELAADGKVSLAQMALTGGANWLSKVSDFGRRVGKSQRIGELANLFTAPDSVAQMQRMVARGPSTVIPETIARAGLNGLNVLYGDQPANDQRGPR
jgi:hypothetical protein